MSPSVQPAPQWLTPIATDSAKPYSGTACDLRRYAGLLGRPQRR